MPDRPMTPDEMTEFEEQVEQDNEKQDDVAVPASDSEIADGDPIRPTEPAPVVLPAPD